MVIGAEFSDDSGTYESVIQTCPKGFGDTWDQPGQFQVIWGDVGPSIIYMRGDVTETLIPDSYFEIREPDPGVGLLTLQVISATYDALTDRTAVVSNTYSGVPWIPVAAPPDNTLTSGEAYALYRSVDGYEIELSAGSNTIVVRQNLAVNPPLAGYFIPGLAVEVRSSADPVANLQYRVVVSQQLSPTEVLLVVANEVHADGVQAGAEILPAGFGYDEPPFCGSPDLTLLQPVIVDRLDIQTFEADGVTPSFQYFIIEADTGTNTFVVGGDARDDLTVGTNFDVINAVQSWATVVQVPLINGAVLNQGYGATPNPNNGSYTVTSVSFDPVAGRTTVGVASVPASLPTGFIIPV